MHRVTRCGRSIFLSLIGSSVAIAGGPVSIPIANPGFEEDVVSPGCFQALPSISGWITYDPELLLDGGSNAIGGINIPPGSVFFPAGAPEGEHAALIFLETVAGLGPVGLRQELGVTLEPNTTYTLTVQVGDIASGTGPPPCDVFGEFDLDGFPGYQVQLLAGDLVIGQDDNTLAGVIDDGEFGLSTTRVCIGANHPQLGTTLEIRLINLNLAETPEDPGIEVDFDDVQLVVEPNLDPLLGDIDVDCDVDFADFGQLTLCWSGPAQPPLAGCPLGADADFDNDNDVDLLDFAELSRQFTGDL